MQRSRTAAEATGDSARLEILVSEVGVAQKEFAQAVREGLSAENKSLPCEFLYDKAGSELFEQICELPEYYPTRTEASILRDNADDILEGAPVGLTLVELGSGSATKTRILIEALLERRGSLRFVPIDISKSILEVSSRELLEDHPGLSVLGIATEYQAGLRLLRERVPGPKLVLWLGSNVGNFERSAAASFLAQVHDLLDPADRFLMGADLRKDRATLERAYDDAAGVTARFNLNLLDRINRELGGHFDLTRFRHSARYDEADGRVEINIVSTADQAVAIDALDMTVQFSAEEKIHTENSHKYSLREIEALAEQANFRVAGQWLDAQERFSLTRLTPA